MSETDFSRKVQERQTLLRRRTFPMAGENMPPTGQAADWYHDAIISVPRTGRHVAKQLARLCGDDSKVTLPWRSLADAVGKTNKAGKRRSYTERGAAVLVEAGWLKVETVGRGRSARTTFYLVPGERGGWSSWEDEDDRLAVA